MSTQIDRATCEGLSSLHDEFSIVVRERLVDFLGFESIDDIGPKDAFADLGTDSRQAVEFKILLEEMLGCKLRTTVLFEHPTIDRLVDFLCTQVDLPTSRRDFRKSLRSEALQHSLRSPARVRRAAIDFLKHSADYGLSVNRLPIRRASMYHCFFNCRCR